MTRINIQPTHLHFRKFSGIPPSSPNPLTFILVYPSYKFSGWGEFSGFRLHIPSSKPFPKTADQNMLSIHLLRCLVVLLTYYLRGSHALASGVYRSVSVHMNVHECVQYTDTEETKQFYKVIILTFLLVILILFFYLTHAQKNHLRLNHWRHMVSFKDVFGCFLMFSGPLLSMEDEGTLRFHLKYLHLCSKDDQRSWVWNDIMVSRL